MEWVALDTIFLTWVCFVVQVLVNTYPHSFVALARLNSYKCTLRQFLRSESQQTFRQYYDELLRYYVAECCTYCLIRHSPTTPKVGPKKPKRNSKSEIK